MVTIQERTLSVWGEQIRSRVKIAGQGPPLVFLHGTTGLRWDEFLDNLTQTHTVYAPEHPGTTPGDPDAIKPLDDFWDLVLYYYEIFDRLGLESPAVVGHSFGGMVAGRAGGDGPQAGWEAGADKPARPVAGRCAGQELDVHGRRRPGEGALLRARGAGRPRDTGGVRRPGGAGSLTRSRTRGTWGVLGSSPGPIPDKGLKKRIHRIQAPTLVVWGQQDGIAPAVYAKEFTDRIAGARSEIVDRAAHIPQLEQLAAVSQLVRDFLGN